MQITNCPSCDSLLVRVKDQLFCKNNTCPAQGSKKVEKYCKALKIRGLGPKSLEKLEIESIAHLYELSNKELEDALGTTNGTKVYNEIAKSVNTTLADLLPAFSIPLVGKTAALKVGAGISDIEQITSTHCRDAGLGEKATKNLLNFLVDEYEDIGYIFTDGAVMDNGQDKGVVVLTGKLSNGMSRAKATELLRSNGYKVTGTVSKNTNYLICEDDSTSSKTKKAQDLGIQTTTLEELIHG